MKKLLTLLCTMFLVANIQGQTIHWLTFIDTNDESVGQMDTNAQALLFSHFRNVVNAALSTAGYKADNQEYFGTRLTPQNCKNAVTSLRCDENDIVIFYYIGHGTHAAKENNPFPQMLMGKGWSEESQFIPLKWVHDILRNKGARLSITIGMCCNPIQGATAKDAPRFSSSAFALNFGNTYITEEQIDHIKTLFLESKGSIIQATAKVGELSWGYPFNDMGNIDSFSRFLILQFSRLMQYGETTTWSSFLGTISNNVTSFQKKVVADNPDMIREAHPYSPYQTPFNEINISAAPRPRIPRQQPQNISVDNLEEYISFIIDKNISYDKRKNAANQTLTLFAKNASVKILSQDGDKVIDKESPNSFLIRLSTSRILLNVALVECSLDAYERISELKIREVYRQ